MGSIRARLLQDLACGGGSVKSFKQQRIEAILAHCLRNIEKGAYPQSQKPEEFIVSTLDVMGYKFCKKLPK